jgi:hypothetical protein
MTQLPMPVETGSETEIMAETEFFATSADLRPLVQAIEQIRRVLFVRCLSNGGLDKPELVVYKSLLDVPDLGLVTTEDGARQIDYLVIEPDGLDRLQIQPNRADNIPFDHMIQSDETNSPVLMWFTPGGQYENRYIRMGTIHGYHETAQSVAYYLQIVRLVASSFEEIGSRYYGKEALLRGQEGVNYAFELESQSRPVGIWGYGVSVEDRRLVDAQLASFARTTRLSLEESWEWLRIARYDPPFTADGKPFIPMRPPKLDEDEEDEDDEEEDGDAQAGFGYNHTFVYHGDLHHLSLPRIEFTECEIGLFSFHDSDLHEAYIYENDWFDCDFTAADLSRARIGAVFVRCNFTRTIFTGASLRDSSFVDCDFTGATLSDTDLRESIFAGCTFIDAIMDSARLTRKQDRELKRSGIIFSPAQRRTIDWQY